MERQQRTGTGSRPGRQFIRHAAGVPIEIRTVAGRPRRRQPSIDISEGGLSFVSDDEIPIGSTIEIRIGQVDPPFEARARVVWTRRQAKGHCIGVQFLDADDAFRVRMVEQVCSIENYRRRVEAEEGRILSRDEAAQEWITKYAGRFPGG